MSRWSLFACVLGIFSAALWAASSQPAASLEKALDLKQQGQFKEAYEQLAARLKLADEPADKLVTELPQAIDCLSQLGRIEEADALLEQVIAAQSGKWQLLQQAAQSYLGLPHQGFIIAGKFERGGHRGGGQMVNSFDRDRIRALQLMVQAMPLVNAHPDHNQSAAFYQQLGQMIQQSLYGGQSWKLQVLSDLSQLPDYEQGYMPWAYRGSNFNGAPVNADGSPVFYAVAPSWQKAANDGQRWRWAMAEAARLNPQLQASVQYGFAQFLLGQFGVQTMAGTPYWRGSLDQADEPQLSSALAVRTLKENETLAKLAGGVKRFTLPDEFNYILIFRTLADDAKGPYAEQSLQQLASVFTNRRQYPKAADCWKSSINRYGPGHEDFKKKALAQIVGNWGEFRSAPTQPVGMETGFDFRFRNATKVTFTAATVDIGGLLQDVKKYIQSNPNPLQYERLNIDDIGYRLITSDQSKYVSKETQKWDLDLTPPAEHQESRVHVAAPLKKAGAYLVTATVEGGNTCYMVLWLADAALVTKPLENGTLCYVADAATGNPLAANVDAFGWWQQYIKDRQYKIHVSQLKAQTQDNGLATLEAYNANRNNFQWLIVATTPDGRLAYTGFTSIWRGMRHDEQYKADRAFIMTDRPVYRPKQTVRFKAWIARSQYDQQGNSPFAGNTFVMRLMNPKGEEIWKKTLTADEFGGISSDYALDEEATLGVYQLLIDGHSAQSFRVEEYKKPEFFVNVEAPSEPAALGEMITAKVKAEYYFGGAVGGAKVHYKVTRMAQDALWYPPGPWDWLFEQGYWWFAYDYNWYPGWEKWGCPRPYYPWWPRSSMPPEVVMDGQGTLDADGALALKIDTSTAKAVFGDRDHRYDISVEVTDASRRTIVGSGNVLAARQPFMVRTWVDRGWYQVGDQVTAHLRAFTADQKPVKGMGVLKLLKIQYDPQGKPTETALEQWNVNTREDGYAEQSLKAAAPGQYRLSFTLADAQQHSAQGGYIFTVRGEEEAEAGNYRFNELELIPDQAQYAPGQAVRLQINTARPGAAVLLFARPSNGIYLPPKALHLKGLSATESIDVATRDMPNFFVEALTIHNGKVYQEVRQIVVPPASRVLDVAVTPSAASYQPGQKAKLTIKLTDADGKPFVGSTVVSLYDKAVEYISGGSNVQDIRSFFWGWKRSHNVSFDTSLNHFGHNLVKSSDLAMQTLGVFGNDLQLRRGFGSYLKEDGELMMDQASAGGRGGAMVRNRVSGEAMGPMATASPMALAEGKSEASPEAPPEAQTTVRENFADTALWRGALTTDADGKAEVELNMPENLTTWMGRVWAMGRGTQVGQGSCQVITTKNIMVRLQAPRFFTQKDEVTLSAIVHNHFKTAQSVRVVLELEGNCLGPVEWHYKAGDSQTLTHYQLEKRIEVPAEGQVRVDWPVRALNPGTAVVRMKALAQAESDATQQSFPVQVHGMLKTESFSGALTGGQQQTSVSLQVPAERRVAQSRLEVRYSPSLALAIVDALPYLVDYPYGCTEQTLNRFVPTVLTQRLLLDMKLNLRDIQTKRTNLNAQQIGDDAARAAQWKHLDRNAVFDESEVAQMVAAGVLRLDKMQLNDGGWGWFSGYGEQSYPHTTAVVVHGLLVARSGGAKIPDGMIDRGVQWLKTYQAEQNRLLKNFDEQKKDAPAKAHPDAIDALVYTVLAEADAADGFMRDHLYRDRLELPAYAQALFGLALHQQKQQKMLDMVLRNLSQFVVRDAENQTAYLKLPEAGWWYWYGSDTEANAFYLKLLARVDAKNPVCGELAKYLLNNRRHGVYWNNTRDTAYCIEALGEYARLSGEMTPDTTVRLSLDGKQVKSVHITAENLFTFDNKLVIEGADLTDGAHKLEVSRDGQGPVYFNAYLTNFTLEDPITAAGLEIKVQRKFYKLIRDDRAVAVEGERGQAVNQRTERYVRQELAEGAQLKSGDLVEVELEIASKNDYEYIIFEDLKAAGFEPVEVRSGYNDNSLGAYMELRDARVCFFVRQLARGNHSVAYRVRAEIPGVFSALPARASAMYAPELKANSREMKLKIVDE